MNPKSRVHGSRGNQFFYILIYDAIPTLLSYDIHIPGNFLVIFRSQSRREIVNEKLLIFGRDGQRSINGSEFPDLLQRIDINCFTDSGAVSKSMRPLGYSLK